MLRLRPDRHWLALAPDGVALRRPDGSVPELPASSVKEGGTPVTSAILRDLTGPAISHRPVVDCICSDVHARYAVVPWDPNVHRPADEEAVARFALEPLLGGRPDAWEIRLGPARFGLPRLACAMPRELLNTVRGAIRGAGGKGGRIVPLLSLVIERQVERTNGHDTLLLAVTPLHAVAVAWVAGRYLWVRTFSGDLSRLPDLLRRTHLVHGGESLPHCAATVLGDVSPEDISRIIPAGSDIERIAEAGSAVSALACFAGG